jgi:murein DD-endopeptidase MepM/ murein hydrolase activator NlpD
MALPMLAAGAAKGLLGGAAKGVASGVAKGAAKKFLTGKKKQKTEGGTYKKTSKTQDVGKKVKAKVKPKQRKVQTVKLPDSVYKNQTDSAGSTTDKNVSFESLGKQLDNINKTTQTLAKAEEAETKQKKELNKAVRAKKRKDKLSSKEEQLEKKKRSSGISGVLMTTGKNFNVFDFLTNIALGSLAMFALNNYEKIVEILTNISENFTNPFKLIQTLFVVLSTTFRGPVRATFNLLWSGLKKSGTLIKKAAVKLGPALKKVFGGLGTGLVNFAKNVAQKVANFGRGGIGGARKGGKVKPPTIASQKSAAKSKIISKAGQQAAKLTANKGVLGATGKRLLRLGNVFKKVPVIGGLVGLFIDLALGEPLDRAFVNAIGGGIGAWIGGAIGTGLIPIPFVGSFLGGVIGYEVGKWGGNALYDLLRQKMGLIQTKPEDQLAREGKVTDVSQQAQTGPGGQRSSSNNQSGTRTYASASSGEYKSILDLISSVEAPSYDTVNQGHIDGLSNMTIAEARLAAMNTSGSGAMGRYQQMPQFVLGRAKAAGLDPNKDLFNAENQDLLAIKLIDQAGYKKWKAGKMTTEKFAYNLAGTWRGLPEGPSNLTFQDQYASRNKAHTTWANVMRVLGGTQSQPAPTMQPTSQQPTTDVSPMAGGAQPAQLAQQQNQTVTTQGTINDMYKGATNTSQFPTTSGYGMRKHPIHGDMRMHSGVDIAPPGPGYYVGLKVPGKVTRIGNDARGYGKFVIISSDQTGMSYMFAHMATIDVKMGEAYTGQPIGEMGTTGGSTGIHLHYEVYKGGKDGPAVNPEPYMNLLTMGKIDGQVRTQTAQVAPQQSTPNQADSVSSRTSYDPMSQTGGNVVPVPIPGQQQMGGGRGTPMMGGASTQQVLNSYYKSQLMGFLYKQG